MLNEDLLVRVWRSAVLLRPYTVYEVLHLVNGSHNDSQYGTLYFGHFVNAGNEL